MITLSIKSGAGPYRVMVGHGLLASVGQLLKDAGLEGNARLISDENVYRRYGLALEDRLLAAGFSVASFVVPPGEASKSLETAGRLYDWLIHVGTERRDLILALGGGVVGDVAGFVAATFLRGVRFVQLPTSLLAQVDSSVGGKVAINHPRGKNMIGAFYPPSLVVVDPATLASLPDRERVAALAEVAKMGVIMDESLFERLERDGSKLAQLDADTVEGVVARSIALKAQVVEQDEKEAGLRAILNYGHTIGHAVEVASDYLTYRHGEAVAIGMVGAARLALRLGMVDAATVERQERLLEGFGLPAGCPGIPVDGLLEAMGRDKKASRGRLTWVLPERIGRVRIRRDVPMNIVRDVLESLLVGLSPQTS